jgi:hypothetical protein
MGPPNGSYYTPLASRLPLHKPTWFQFGHWQRRPSFRPRKRTDADDCSGRQRSHRRAHIGMCSTAFPDWSPLTGRGDASRRSRYRSETDRGPVICVAQHVPLCGRLTPNTIDRSFIGPPNGLYYTPPASRLPLHKPAWFRFGHSRRRPSFRLRRKTDVDESTAAHIRYRQPIPSS